MDKAAIKFDELITIVKKLRSPDGCSWDKEQTHDSLIPYLLEEIYEVIESIDNKDWKILEEELGDVLLHIVLQSQIAKESFNFDIASCIERLNKKLIFRHPNVYGKSQIKNLNWEESKHKEKKRKSRLDGVPKDLSAMVSAQRLQQKASMVGFDWDKIEHVWDKVYEELDELKNACISKNNQDIEEEIGDVLFSIVNLSRHLNCSAENMLRNSNKKFVSRFKILEKKVNEQGKKIENISLNEMDQIWDNIKQDELV